MQSTDEIPWSFTRFGLIVTGEGEASFVAGLFRPLLATGRCSVEVIRRIGQRAPVTSQKRKLEMKVGGKLIPDRDQREIGLPARCWLQGQKGPAFVILLDDVEAARAPILGCYCSSKMMEIWGGGEQAG